MSAALSPPLQVRVPGSTSNLGPGFDCLGLALSIYLTVECLPREGDGIELGPCSGTAKSWPGGEDNLLIQALRRGLQGFEARTPGIELRAHSEIPVARGLGSSGAAIAAGLSLARALAGENPDQPPGPDVLQWALEMEGHPDNSTASLLGGCTLGVPLATDLRVVQQEFHPSIGIALAWPATCLTTEASRSALPDTLPHADASENPRRLALLLEGLRKGDAQLLREGLLDRLHVPYRLPLIPGGKAAMEAACRAGAYGATISGSGSALVSLGPKDRMEAVAEAMAAALDPGGAPAEGKVVEIVRGFPRVTIL
ncbi:MAG TPA: homoserine kinase [Planctomycetes bacterium]|nr:homoserine kinase [Planctomycetota bacterium]HIK60137.1 homoserine kinase [Planctomycetota bacterium]